MTTSGERAIEADYREAMNKVANVLAEIFPRPLGFTLLVFMTGESPEGRMNYISSAGREEMIIAMKEFIANNEGRAHDAPEGKQ
jgi:hypothetical protein